MTSAAGTRAGPLVIAALLGSLVGSAGSSEPVESRGASETPMPQRTIAEVLRDVTDRIMSIPGVLATAEGQCEGRPCVKVFVEKKTSALLRQLPTVVEGYPVAVEESDEFRARDR